MKSFSLAAFIFAGTVIVVGLFVLARGEERWSFAGDTMPASVFFAQSVTADDLRSTFTAASSTEKKIKVLIVPGHEPDFGGAEFLNIKERDLNANLARILAQYLVEDGHFEITTTRDENGWNPELQEYFAEYQKEIADFARTQKEEMGRLVGEGRIVKAKGVVPHNKAPDDVALRLYGINKWANDRGVDIIIHIHFNNDFSLRKTWEPGKYNGVAIYTPERQYSNAEASTEIAQRIFKRISRMFPVSDLPKEDAGVVEDQDLIAVGSNNTVDGASVLIEYGYIYEPQFRTPSVRAVVLQELAFQTYLGLADFFGEIPKIVGPHESTFLPYRGGNTVQKTNSANREVLLFQAALLDQGFYPPQGHTRNDCPLSGVFGPCTRATLSLFQDKFAITSEQGIIGPTTRTKLRELFEVRYR